jgi:putative heme-binding domain-containing protein
MDWCDKYPCYQNAQADPDGVDRELGRIWRVVWVGDHPGKPVPSRPDKNMALKSASAAELAKMLDSHPNIWQRRQAQRLLGEGRFPKSELTKALNAHVAKPSGTRAAIAFAQTRLALGTLRGEPLDSLLNATVDTELRTWLARLTGELHDAGKNSLARLRRLAEDPQPSVRAAVATALRQLTSASLTVDKPSPVTVATADLLPHFRELVSRPSVEGDFYYPHIVWMAMEPRVAQDPELFFPLLSATNSSVSAYCLRRVMRRICDLSDSATRTRHLDAAIGSLANLADQTSLADAALDGLIDAFKTKGRPPSIPLHPIFAKLTANPALADKARRLATLLGDVSASRMLIARINDTRASVEDRLKGITAARESKDEAAKAELLKLLRTSPSPSAEPKASATSGQGTPNTAQQLYVEAVRALSVIGGDEIAYAVVDAWKTFTQPTRRAAADVLVTRSKWSRALLAGVDKKIVEPQDVSASARRALARSEDATLREHADRVLGRYRASGEDKLKLMAEKRKVVLAGEPDLKAGYEVAKRVCFVCHKLYGEGADVGPDLTGVGRSSLEALLHNIIDPNEVIGNGFENTEVELKDGRTLNGRIIENTDTRLKLLASGPTEHLVSRSDIAIENGKPKVRTSDVSLMPEGLEQMPDEDFRNLIWYFLNPPQDNRPWTPALRKELIGDGTAPGV